MNSIYYKKYLKYKNKYIQLKGGTVEILTHDFRIYKLNGELIENMDALKNDIKTKEIEYFKIHEDYIKHKLNKLKELCDIIIILLNDLKDFPELEMLIIDDCIKIIDNLFNNYNILLKEYIDTNYIRTIELIKQLINDIEFEKNFKTNIEKLNWRSPRGNIYLLKWLNYIVEIHKIFNKRLQIKFSIIYKDKEDDILTKKEIDKILEENEKYKYITINDINNFKIIDKNYSLSYIDIKIIIEEIKEALDNLFMIIIKVPIDELNNTIKININILVDLLNKYKINYIYDIFNLEFYFTQKKTELDNIEKFDDSKFSKIVYYIIWVLGHTHGKILLCDEHSIYDEYEVQFYL